MSAACFSSIPACLYIQVSQKNVFYEGISSRVMSSNCFS